MPYSDFGHFLPAESTFKTPGTYKRALQSQATKKAAYLSEMDKFYTALNEQAREFDITTAQDESQFSRGLSQQQRQFLDTLGLQEDQLSHQEAFDWTKLASGVGIAGANWWLENKGQNLQWDAWQDIVGQYFGGGGSGDTGSLWGAFEETLPDIYSEDILDVFGGTDYASDLSDAWPSFDF